MATLKWLKMETLMFSVKKQEHFLNLKLFKLVGTIKIALVVKCSQTFSTKV